ncbi:MULTISPECIES: acyl carrier protein [unclassified Streptomyces]|jgi:acyl carrier protein|uniref:acyl carrier protein n=1 Tax=unclassified Streptomyces TaxID=2593676 RepID=UPI000A1D8E3A|nr:acyl carrier protein [Streptomyces sp. 13-12-16]OSP41409.1 polyketide-8 synthase acyl carrier protein [Streptomyces sp. 13-12-16]
MSVTPHDTPVTAVPSLDELRGIVSEILDTDAEDVTDDADFVADLEVDSLMALEVVVVLEKRFGVKFAEAELRQVTSLGQAHQLLTRKIPAQ